MFFAIELPGWHREASAASRSPAPLPAIGFCLRKVIGMRWSHLIDFALEYVISLLKLAVHFISGDRVIGSFHYGTSMTSRRQHDTCLTRSCIPYRTVAEQRTPEATAFLLDRIYFEIAPWSKSSSIMIGISNQEIIGVVVPVKHDVDGTLLTNCANIFAWFRHGISIHAQHIWTLVDNWFLSAVDSFSALISSCKSSFRGSSFSIVSRSEPSWMLSFSSPFDL